MACFGADDSGEGDEEGGRWPGEHKYDKAYEARLNPFEGFKQAEADRGRAALPPHDRVLLSGDLASHGSIMLGDQDLRVAE